MNFKIVYQTDASGYFVGETEAYESPLEPGVYHLPAGCYESAPPSTGPGQKAKHVGNSWSVVNVTRISRPDGTFYEAECSDDVAPADVSQPEQPSLSEQIFKALGEIDAEAGQARMRYITSVPGQEATYLLKQQQAEFYVANPTAPVPPYIQAEAEAAELEPLAAAESILETAALWNEQLGPQIEKERRRWKIAAGAATSAEQLAEILEGARATISSI